MATPLRLAASHLTGWLADRQVPRPLRAALYRSYGAVTGCDLSECQLPLASYPSLCAFFTRRLVAGARPIPDEKALLVSPVDGTVQHVGEISSEGAVVQAKGRDYPVRQLLAGIGEDIPLKGGQAWTIYLSPRDYHRMHAPEDCELRALRWVDGSRFSVNPRVLARRDVLAVNERCVLEFMTPHGPLLAVLVGALNVGRIRVVGVEPGHAGPLASPRKFARGEEFARFEMGSTIILLTPPGVASAASGLVSGKSLRLGEPIGRFQSEDEKPPSSAQ